MGAETSLGAIEEVALVHLRVEEVIAARLWSGTRHWL